MSTIPIAAPIQFHILENGLEPIMTAMVKSNMPTKALYSPKRIPTEREVIFSEGAGSFSI
jgi:hypothetical protein